jgi:hypothetical protein
MSKVNISLTIKPAEFFREKVRAALSRQRVEISEEIEFYLVTLLCDFITPGKIETIHGEIDLFDTPLALVLKTALESPSEHQYKLYKSIGDTSLYMAGYFQDSFNEKTVSSKYFMELGASAYLTASTLTERKQNFLPPARIFKCLSASFPDFVEIVADIAEKLEQDSQGLLATYTRWKKNQSKRLEQTLLASGMLPHLDTTKCRQ